MLSKMKKKYNQVNSLTKLRAFNFLTKNKKKSPVLFKLISSVLTKFIDRMIYLEFRYES